MPNEPVIDPALPIIDAHHHLWFQTEGQLAAVERSDSLMNRALAPMYRRHARYLFDEFLGDVESGHNVRASVFVDAHAMYRAHGPEAMRSVGEIEFVNGVAAMGASGLFGDVRPCAGIVGGVDLSIGDAVEEVLLAHLRAGGDRYRGVRSPVIHDGDPRILGTGVGMPHLLLDRRFHRGFKLLERFGLSFDAFVLEPQLPDVIALARKFPGIQIILDHVGTPVGIGRYAGQREQRFGVWRRAIRGLAACENVAVKLGGLGIPFGGFKSYFASPPMTSAQLAEEWRPYIESCIDAFGVGRCMFESNFPPDSAAGSYPVLWNAWKRLVAGASDGEKADLFSGTAKRIYRLDV